MISVKVDDDCESASSTTRPLENVSTKVVDGSVINVELVAKFEIGQFVALDTGWKPHETPLMRRLHAPWREFPHHRLRKKSGGRESNAAAVNRAATSHQASLVMQSLQAILAQLTGAAVVCVVGIVSAAVVGGVVAVSVSVVALPLPPAAVVSLPALALVVAGDDVAAVPPLVIDAVVAVTLLH
jgi:hypothetical protein